MNREKCNAKPKPLCTHCNKALKTIRNDWDSRPSHKKCWKLKNQELERDAMIQRYLNEHTAKIEHERNERMAKMEQHMHDEYERFETEWIHRQAKLEESQHKA